MRIEIEEALARDVRVIPVLVDGASMPVERELPASLRPLAERQAVRLAHERFAADADGLAEALTRLVPAATPARAAARRHASGTTSTAPSGMTSTDPWQAEQVYWKRGDFALTLRRRSEVHRVEFRRGWIFDTVLVDDKKLKFVQWGRQFPMRFPLKDTARSGAAGRFELVESISGKLHQARERQLDRIPTLAGLSDADRMMARPVASPRTAGIGSWAPSGPTMHAHGAPYDLPRI